MKRLALYTVIVLATIGGAALIYFYPEAVVMFIISLTIAAAVRPMLDGLAQRGLPAGLAAALTFLLIFAGIGLMVWGISTLVVYDIAMMGDGLSKMYDYMWATWPHGTQIQQLIINQLPAPEDLYSSIAGEQGGALVQTLVGLTSSSAGVLTQFFGALVLSIYWTADRIHFERLWLSLLPVETRARWRKAGRDIEDALGNYVRSELAQSLMVAVLLGIGFTLMGMPYPSLLALFSAVAWLLPWIGGAIAIIAIVIIGLTAGFPLLLFAPLYALAVMLVMELLVEPRISRRTQYSPWLTIILLMMMGEALGLFGIILAPPLAAMILIIARRILQETQTVEVTNQEIESARRIAELDERLMAVREMIANMEEPPSLQTTSMLERLTELVQKAQEMSRGQP
jgi:predicted PurR-regulated permease PerM